MSKYKRDSFLKEIYEWKVYRGRNYLLNVGIKEMNFYKQIINYWLEKGFVVKREKLGRIVLRINSEGIDYIEKEVL